MSIDVEREMGRLALDLLALPAKARADLAYRLIRSLDEDHSPGTEQQWLDVAKRRAAELAEGKVEGIPAEDVSRDLKNRVG